MRRCALFICLYFVIAAGPCSAQEATAALDTGDTTWVLISTALVMLMTPGLALFYGGMVRRKNVLGVLMKCFIAMAALSIQWVLWGYSLAFAPGNSFIGGLGYLGLKGVGLMPGPYSDTIPHQLFMMFQGMFAIITPALIIGAFVERMKFSSFLIFIVLWATLVYDPVCHWVWGAGGWIGAMGALDFAGGSVVHINAGIAALVTALIIGKRKSASNVPTPHNLPLTVLGTALLWFGWFGFNGGSALAADGIAVNAFVVTNTAAAAAALAWATIEWMTSGRPTMLGVVTGAVAGLVAITPAAGFVGVVPAMVLGFAASTVCFFAVSIVKPKLGYDDSLDAFGVHGIGGIVGALLTGVFTSTVVNAGGADGLLAGNAAQMWPQFVSVIATMGYSLVVTFILYKVIDITIGVRVDKRDEVMGIDLAQHHERAYTLID